MPSLYPDPEGRRLASDHVAAGGACARVRRRPTVGPAEQGSGHAVKAAVQKVAFENGGEFIRDLNDDPPLRKRPVEQHLSKMIEYGGPLLSNAGEDQQRSFDSTCRKFRRFLTEKAD